MNQPKFGVVAVLTDANDVKLAKTRPDVVIEIYRVVAINKPAAMFID